MVEVTRRSLSPGELVSGDAADVDDEEDGTSAECFELKAPDNPPAIKRGPYRV
jgi:hypothetical protein